MLTTTPEIAAASVRGEEDSRDRKVSQCRQALEHCAGGRAVRERVRYGLADRAAATVNDRGPVHQRHF
jgi:hypothetical protein